MHRYIWQREEWPDFNWDTNELLIPLGECRLAQGRLISRVAGMGITMERNAQAEILIEEIIKTSAIEGELLDARSVRSSVARRLGIPTAGLPVDRRIDDLVSLLLDATMNCMAPLTAGRLWGWQAALFPTGYLSFFTIIHPPEPLIFQEHSPTPPWTVGQYVGAKNRNTLLHQQAALESLAKRTSLGSAE